ncbi:tumor necrosis factor receptor superfamily member 16-like [Discoglossus pictus]
MALRGPLLTLCLLLLHKVSAEDVCPPGFGKGATDKCEPCIENSTFSLNSTCQPCSVCESVYSSCTLESDTVCKCHDDHYSQHGQCNPCRVCSKGQGVVTNCTLTEDTVCQLCPDGYYSEVKSSKSPCMPCKSECKETEVQIAGCAPQHDLLCMAKDVPILKRTDADARKDDNSTIGSPHFIPRDDHSKNIIPVYCSILAAVVVGLIGYVAFKCYSTCKQKKQLAKARAGELATAGEGEKLHSDSGVFLDTHSLQEQNHLSKVKIEPKLYVNLPPHKQEEVERLLMDTSRGKDWQRLASLLGYEEDTIDTFGRGEDPVHTLLTDWSSKESSTLEVLCAALVNMERADVVENLNSATDASSVV